MNEQILQMSGISKYFAGVKALKDVDFDLKKGEVHALMGENGAGKSTLMKILTGIYSRDTGSVVYEGNPVEFKKPRDAQDAGIVIVHQELNMINDLTVAKNVFIGREWFKGPFIDDARMVHEAQKLFSAMHVDIDPRAKMGDLPVGKQQICEIAKAISTDAKVVVFDEPTAALTDSEIKDLFVIIRQLRDKGTGIIYITHRMDEIKRITDRVTVMRDGEYIGTIDSGSSSKDEIIKMMVGRVVYEDPKQKSAVPKDAPVVLQVENLNAGRAVKDLSFILHKGEIVGFSGLMGAGRTEMARAIFGADRRDSGTITVKGEKVNIRSPQDAVKHGIGYLSEDRKRFGLVEEKSVASNISLAALTMFLHGGFVNATAENENAQKYVDKLKIKTPTVTQQIRKLSGGNQQKAIIGKWLTCDSDILIFDEPTRGIDVGAKAEIYELMAELTKQGKSIIMISSELTEILRMSDRVLVMCEGRKTAEIDIENATQEGIMAAATFKE